MKAQWIPLTGLLPTFSDVDVGNADRGDDEDEVADDSDNDRDDSGGKIDRSGGGDNDDDGNSKGM